MSKAVKAKQMQELVLRGSSYDRELIGEAKDALPAKERKAVEKALDVVRASEAKTDQTAEPSN